MSVLTTTAVMRALLVQNAELLLVYIVKPLIPQRCLELISSHLALAVRVGLGKERRVGLGAGL